MHIETPRGEVVITHRCSAETLRRLEMGPGLGVFFHFDSERQKEALVRIAERADSWVTVAHPADQLVGYVTFHPPSPYTRWGKQPIAGLIELGGIEVSPEWRCYHVSRAMLQTAFADPVVDDLIVISTGMHWYWDIEGTGLTSMDYRAMLGRMFAPYGFKRYKTDEPNMASYTGNILVARIGSRVSPEKRYEFEESLFVGDNNPAAGESLTKLYARS